MGVSSVSSAVSLGEGSTPLVLASRLSAELGGELHVKYEGLNPTGSFKDRGMVVAVSRAVDAGARAVVCASTGNTAASAAAYAARAGIQAVVVTPVGATAGPKRAQARAAGARLLEVRGSFDDALRLCRLLAEQDGYVLVNSINPDRLEGQQSVVGEILDQLGGVPDVVALPYGGGGNVCAIAAGFARAGASPRLIVGEALQRADTWASAIRIAEPAHADEVAELVAAGRVEVVSLSDEELRADWERLVTLEGVFCEPASAAGVAALRRSGRGHTGLAGKVAVAIVTGHGLKDTANVTEPEVPAIEASLEAILEALA
jgi:threonine synthase